MSEAEAYFELANAYATRGSIRPQLLVTMGLPATGKTTLAHALARRLGLVPLSSDVLRKRLVGARPTTHRTEEFGRGLYSRSMTRRTYALLLRKAAHWLRRRQSVVLDATFGQPADRAAVHQLAGRTNSWLLVVVCRATEAVIRERLAARATDNGSTSDARLELWPALRAAFVEPNELVDALHADMSLPLEQVLSDVVRCATPSPSEPSSPRAA
jgi:uncharacterized protein